jgi:hypothetical protein
MRRHAAAGARKQRLASLDVGAESEGEHSAHIRPMSAVSATLSPRASVPSSSGGASDALPPGRGSSGGSFTTATPPSPPPMPLAVGACPGRRRRATSDILAHGSLSAWASPAPSPPAAATPVPGDAPGAPDGPQAGEGQDLEAALDITGLRGGGAASPLSITAFRQPGVQPPSPLPQQQQPQPQPVMQHLEEPGSLGPPRKASQGSEGPLPGPVARSLSRAAASSAAPCPQEAAGARPDSATPAAAPVAGTAAAQAAASVSTSGSASASNTRPTTAGSSYGSCTSGGGALVGAGLPFRKPSGMGAADVATAAAWAQAQLVQGFLGQRPRSAGGGGGGAARPPLGGIQGARALKRCPSGGGSQPQLLQQQQQQQQQQLYADWVMTGATGARPASGSRGGYGVARQGALGGASRGLSASPPKIPAEVHTASGPLAARQLQRSGQAAAQEWSARRRTLDQLLTDLQRQRAAVGTGGGRGSGGGDAPAKQAAQSGCRPGSAGAGPGQVPAAGPSRTEQVSRDGAVKDTGAGGGGGGRGQAPVAGAGVAARASAGAGVGSAGRRRHTVDCLVMAGARLTPFS